MPEHILEANNLVFSYDSNNIILKDISVKIEKGKKTVFLGENGAGKSTLFLHFNGILKPTKGKILYKGKEVKYNQADLMHLRKNVGIVFQDPETQLFSASVSQEVSFGPLNLGFDKEKVEKLVEQALETTGITLLRDEPTHFLSYGQKKRVTIASIISMEPETIIFDEPTCYLDPKHKLQLIEFLNELSKNGTTIVLSTHDVDFAYHWADYIIVMKNGAVIKEGKPEEIFRDLEIMEKTNLSMPTVLELHDQLKSCGFIDDNLPLPKDKNELLDLIGKSSRCSLK